MARRKRRHRKPPRQTPPDNYRLEGSTVPEPEPEPTISATDARLAFDLIAGLRDQLPGAQMFIAGRPDGAVLVGILLTRGEGPLSVSHHDHEDGTRPWDAAIGDLTEMLDNHPADGVRIITRAWAEESPEQRWLDTADPRCWCTLDGEVCPFCGGEA